jgi:hypothetical protein
MIAEGRSHLQSHVAAIGPWHDQQTQGYNYVWVWTLDATYVQKKSVKLCTRSKHSKRVRSMAAPLHRSHHAAGVVVTLEVEEYFYVPGKENKFGKNCIASTF